MEISRMRIRLAVAIVAAILMTCGCAQSERPQAPPSSSPSSTSDKPLQANMLLDGGQVVLPSGWKISPAGHATKLPGDMPERILFAPDGRQLLVNTGGFNEHGISVLDAQSGKLLQHVKVPRTFVGM